MPEGFTGSERRMPDTYEILAGCNFPPNGQRAEVGETITDVPADVAKSLVANKAARKLAPAQAKALKKPPRSIKESD